MITFPGKGNGGLAELQNEFSQSKILYAFCEVKDDSNNLRRFILINWASLFQVYLIIEINQLMNFFYSKVNVHRFNVKEFV